ncbi:hypothetical protein D3C87_1674770 [compost metagenome]
MILQRIALFAVEAETLPRGLTNCRIFNHHFRHAGELPGEGRDFQVEVDQQILVQTAVIAKAQHDHPLGLAFGGTMRHEAFALEGPQARIEIVTLGGIAAMQVDAVAHAPGFLGELAGEIQPRRRIGAGQDIEVDFGHCGSWNQLPRNL